MAADIEDLMDLTESQISGEPPERAARVEAMAATLLEQMARTMGSEQKLRAAVAATLLGEVLGAAAKSPNGLETECSEWKEVAYERGLLRMVRRQLDEIRDGRAAEDSEDE